MKVLMMMKDSEIGGVASCVASLADGLKKYKNVEVIIAASNGDSIGSIIKDAAIVDFASKNPIQILKNYKKIKRIVKNKQIDIIHAQNRIPAFYAAFYCFFHRNTDYIWSNHLVPIPSDIVHRILTFYGKCAVSEGLDGKEMLINDFGIDPNKVSTVNLGIDIDKLIRLETSEQTALREKFGIDEKEKIILLYGRLDPVKGHDFLLDAIKKYADKSFRLVFPGENERYKIHIMEKAKELGLQSNLIFPGYIDGPAWLSISDLMVLPSKKEGFGIVNVEAFVMGVPVIRTTTGGYRDMKDLCLGVDYGDVDELERLLQKFFDNDSEFEEIKIRAKKGCQRFSLESYTNGYYEIYKKAIGL